MAHIKHLTIALNLPKAVPKLLLFGRFVVQSMDGNPYFVDPTLPLATLSADLDKLEDLESKVFGRGLGAAALRDVAQRTVEAGIEVEKGYVLWIAAQQPELLAVIIASSGMSQKKFVRRPKPALEARMGPAPGQVILRAKAVARKGASYEWQISSDGGVTWVTMGFTNMADTSTSGLTAGVTYRFRFRSTIKRTTSGWGDSISFMVH